MSAIVLNAPFGVTLAVLVVGMLLLSTLSREAGGPSALTRSTSAGGLAGAALLAMVIVARFAMLAA